MDNTDLIAKPPELARQMGVDRYVQPVPVHCDRITWRGNYYSLPIKRPSQEPGLSEENARLRVALRFYANGEHYVLDGDEDFDTVSGEPANWLCSGIENSATSIEDGSVARLTLLGKVVIWSDGDEDYTPTRIEGEPPAEPIGAIDTSVLQAATWPPVAEQPSQTVDVLQGIMERVQEMQAASYTFGDYSKEAVDIALDGVMDIIQEAINAKK